MKNLFQLFEYLSDLILRFGSIIIVLIGLISLIGFSHLRKTYEREIGQNLESTTSLIWAIWNSVTIAHEETMQAIFERHIVDEKTLEILRRANSPKEEERAIARAQLYRHLIETYEYLRKNYLLRQLHFHTPDNHSFLRFHAPAFYGDDLSPHRPTVVLTNKLKKPHYSFETGRVITGFRYVFPIIDPSGNHLGSVELSRSFEVTRRYLLKVYPEGGYFLLLRKSEVFHKLLEPFRKYYSEFHGLPEWVIEDPFREFPDSPPPLTPDQERALKEAVKNPNFRDLLEKRENGTIYVKVDSKVYKISLIKLFEPNKENHTGVVVAILPGDDIAQVLRAQNSMIIFYITANLLLILAVLAFWYQARIIKRKKREFETIVEIMGSGLILFDKKGTITYINDYGAKLLKYEKEALLGKMLDELLPLNGESLDKSPLKQAIMNGSAFTGDETLRCGDGSELVAFVVSRPLRIDQTFEGSIVSFVDISERIRFERELFKTSLTDCLTGLYNRRFIEEELEKSRALSERYGIPFSVLMIDIDDFKKINDHFGHDVGDLVLKTLATVLKHNSREADSVARWGGEEFLVLLHNTNFEGALSIAERLRKTVASLRLKDIPSFTISIGVTSFKKGESIESLLRRVDTALYEAKKAGKNTTVGAVE